MEQSLHTEKETALSREKIQSREILQMAAVRLKEYLEGQILENPVIELSEKAPEQFEKREMEKYQWIRTHDEQNRYLYQKMETNEEELPEWNLKKEDSESLWEHLWGQLLTRDWPAEWKEALRYLLHSLDYRGYFADSLEELARMFGLDSRQAEAILALVQSLEPAGVGARSLEECLCLQLERMGKRTPEAEAFVRDHLAELAGNQLSSIAQAMELPLEAVEEYARLIKELNPKPGAPFSDVRQVPYILPDVVVVKFRDHFDILLNESLYPDIFLNPEYLEMARTQTDPEVTGYLKEKIHQAEWLKQCVARRNRILFAVVQEILTRQMDFFRRGAAFLKPLSAAEVAAGIDVRESTVNQAVKDKYLQCPWGIFPLGYFFGGPEV